MAKTHDLKPDTVLKNYWRNNDQFADFFNAVLFDGRPVIRPEELEDVDTEESVILEHRKYAESIKASRDNIKIQKRSRTHGVEFVMLGLESQEHIHYAMPIRVMGYDYSTYKKQYDSNAKKYKTADGMKPDEYLSRMKKTDRFMPVITVVVYYGEKPWDGALTLHDMLHIPEEMKKYVNDYQMLLVEARQNNLVLHNSNNIDLFHLLEIILDKSIPGNEAKAKAIQYSEEHQTDKSVIMAVAGATDGKLDYHAFEKEGGRMCTLFEEIAKEGKMKGREEGREEGKAEEIVETGMEFHLSEQEILDRLQRKLNITPSKAQEYYRQYNRQMV